MVSCDFYMDSGGEPLRPPPDSSHPMRIEVERADEGPGVLQDALRV